MSASPQIDAPQINGVLISLADIEAARVRIAPLRTPHAGADQRRAGRGGRRRGCSSSARTCSTIGAFKARGATNAVLLAQRTRRPPAASPPTRPATRPRRWRCAARLRGIPAYIVMPEGAARPKAAQVERLGGRITFCAPTLAAREASRARIVAETGAAMIHPFDDPAVMAGQGTAALELMEDAPDLDIVLAPIGGGGLISGVSTAVKAAAAAARVIGAEPAGADDAARSFAAGRLIPLTEADTIADGLRASLSPATFAHIRRGVDEVVTVSERGHRRGHARALGGAEGGGRALRRRRLRRHARRQGRRCAGQRVGIILTGGNVDLDKLPWT